MAQHHRKNSAGRRERAVARNQDWAKRTLVQQVDSLESRGHGHCRQAVRLRNIINADPTAGKLPSTGGRKGKSR